MRLNQLGPEGAARTTVLLNRILHAHATYANYATYTTHDIHATT